MNSFLVCILFNLYMKFHNKPELYLKFHLLLDLKEFIKC
jgi:hypothetical protein